MVPVNPPLTARGSAASPDKCGNISAYSFEPFVLTPNIIPFHSISLCRLQKMVLDDSPFPAHSTKNS